MHLRPILNTVGVEGKTSASDSELRAETRIFATDSTARGPFAIDNENVESGGFTDNEDDFTTCCGTRSWPLPVSITHAVRFKETCAPWGMVSAFAVSSDLTLTSGIEPR